MLTREEIQGSWMQLKGKIRERWGQITDDELQQAQGDGEQLMGLLQKKTGQSKQEVEKFIRSTIDQGEGVAERGQRYAKQAAEGAREYAQQATETMREGYESVEQGIHQGYEQAEQMVRSRPMESLTTAFGAGLITGVIVSLMLRSNRT